MTKMTVEEVTDFLDREFPEVHAGGQVFTIEASDRSDLRVRMEYHKRLLRPGGTISGPSMFTLADYGIYATILCQIGPKALAVTTNLTINFLRKPAQRDMIAEIRILKTGKRLITAEACLFSDGEPDLVAHAIATYSVPPVN